jgi:hypothetical protein
MVVLAVLVAGSVVAMLIGEENFDASCRVIAWLCWVPNAVVAELYIRRRQSIANVSNSRRNIAV